MLSTSPAILTVTLEPGRFFSGTGLVCFQTVESGKIPVVYFWGDSSNVNSPPTINLFELALEVLV